jgi:phosphatidylinositol N-acetylglucosaminyltransferase subunit Q
MHPFSSLTIFIFVAGYITARWDLVTRLYELAVFAWDHGVISRAAKAFTIISLIYVGLAIPLERLAAHEASVHPRSLAHGISAHEQLRRRGSF